eukprot:314977-Chlamydomonas_euryale.AAC.2
MHMHSPKEGGGRATSTTAKSRQHRQPGRGSVAATTRRRSAWRGGFAYPEYIPKPRSPFHPGRPSTRSALASSPRRVPAWKPPPPSHVDVGAAADVCASAAAATWPPPFGACMCPCRGTRASTTPASAAAFASTDADAAAAAAAAAAEGASVWTDSSAPTAAAAFAAAVSAAEAGTDGASAPLATPPQPSRLATNAPAERTCSSCAHAPALASSSSDGSNSDSSSSTCMRGRAAAAPAHAAAADGQRCHMLGVRPASGTVDALPHTTLLTAPLSLSRARAPVAELTL